MPSKAQALARQENGLLRQLKGAKVNLQQIVSTAQKIGFSSNLSIFHFDVDQNLNRLINKYEQERKRRVCLRKIKRWEVKRCH